MDTNRMIRIFAGAFVLISLALGAPASPLEIVLKRFGVREA